MCKFSHTKFKLRGRELRRVFFSGNLEVDSPDVVCPPLRDESKVPCACVVPVLEHFLSKCAIIGVVVVE